MFDGKAAVGFDVATGVKRYGFASFRRLKTPAEFSSLLRAPRESSIRAERQMLSINTAWVAAASSPVDGTKAGDVRFGVTVGKRTARRSVDRALVKRIVREACRHRAAAFEDCAAQGSARIDVALAPLPFLDAGNVSTNRAAVPALSTLIVMQVSKHFPWRLIPNLAGLERRSRHDRLLIPC